MFFKKTKITELEKAEIIFDYLHEELQALCSDRDFRQPHCDGISLRISYVNEQLNFINKKIEIFRSIDRHK